MGKEIFRIHCQSHIPEKLCLFVFLIYLFFALVYLRWERGERNQKSCCSLTLMLWFCPFHIYSTSTEINKHEKFS